MSQVVDTESAKEFMKEALAKVSPDELNQICGQLERKSQLFRSWLGPEVLQNGQAPEMYKILRNIFSTRRKAQKLLETFSQASLSSWMRELLYGEQEIGQRFQAFCDHLDGVETPVRYDLASEVLHFTFPGRFWLWTRWMWDPKTRTGALPLVTTEEYELSSTTLGQTYVKVGEAVAFVHHVGEAAGFQTISRSLFGTDVYLGCVYVIYAYTVLRMRMTQEFNKVVPGLSEFVRRLLGVYRLEE